MIFHSKFGPNRCKKAKSNLKITPPLKRKAISIFQPTSSNQSNDISSNEEFYDELQRSLIINYQKNSITSLIELNFQ